MNTNRMTRNGSSVNPRIALYSHDTMGLGHLRRNILIASVLAEAPINANVLVISGAKEACHFAMQAGVDCVTLPALRKDPNGNYAGKHFRLSCQQMTRLRSTVIASALDAFSPHAFIVDKVPRGVGNELDETLALLRDKGSTRCILGLREILDDPAVVMKQWAQCSGEQTVRDFYDEVWIYGDPAIYDAVRQYAFGNTTANRSFFTGYLDQRRRLPASAVPSNREQSVAVCVVGGGQDGTKLAAAFASAPMPSGWQGILITGPFMPEADRAWLRQTVAEKSDCFLIENLVEADQYIAGANRVVSMAGYNTVTSILSFGKPALVVPRVEPRREQWIRASKLADHGLLTMLDPEALSPAAITSWIRDPQVNTASIHSVDLTGLDRIVDRVRGWFPKTTLNLQPKTSEVSIV